MATPKPQKGLRMALSVGLLWSCVWGLIRGNNPLLLFDSILLVINTSQLLYFPMCHARTKAIDLLPRPPRAQTDPGRDGALDRHDTLCGAL